MKTCTRDLLPAIFVYALVWFGSSLAPSQLGGHSVFRFDKVLHLGEYFVVAMSLGWLLRAQYAQSASRFRFLLLAVGLLWAISDEWHQSFSGRDASFYDVLADLSGLLLYCTLILNKGLRDLLRFPILDRVPRL